MEYNLGFENTSSQSWDLRISAKFHRRYVQSGDFEKFDHARNGLGTCHEIEKKRNDPRFEKEC